MFVLPAYSPKSWNMLFIVTANMVYMANSHLPQRKKEVFRCRLANRIMYVIASYWARDRCWRLDAALRGPVPGIGFNHEEPDTKQQQQEHVHLSSYLKSKCKKKKLKKSVWLPEITIITLDIHIRVWFSGHARHVEGTCIIHSDTDVFVLVLAYSGNLK